MAAQVKEPVMLVGEPQEPRAKRQRLAAELRRLREMAGVSGRDLAQRISMSQSKVSRIESGATTPPVPAVIAWADAVGADPETRARLTAMTEAVFAEVQAWRMVLPGRGHMQGEIEQREALARRVRVFQPSIIPGLLQTAEYARRVFGLFHVPYEDDDLGKAVAARLDRQLALYDEDRQFAFLIAEGALRWRPGPVRVLRAQLDRISSLTTLDNLSIGLIPYDVEATAALPVGFDILDDRDGGSTVTVETLHANLVVTDPSHIADYEQAWSVLGEMAIYGDDAQGLLTEVRRSIGADKE